jgi:glycosyltransferase involved in cell wall biosynthesis
MPNVLCEAMLCECVPVGSAVNSIPDIIGDAGFVVSRPLIPEMKQAIEQAMHSDLGPAARRRIAERYPLERRKRELLETVDHLLQT